MTMRIWSAAAAAAILCVQAPAHAQQTAPATTTLAPTEVIGSTPLLGSGVDRDKVPGESTVLGRAAVQREGSANALRALQENVPGLVLDSASGNPAQPNVFLHGFQVSPLQGTSQGLAVYVGGIRFNQPFGDTVNWDLLPDIAIDSLNVVGSNPAFGLNALGGSVNVQLKNGFTYHGGEATLSGGSFGRVGAQLQYGLQSDNTAAYFAASGLHQRGWRDNQETDNTNVYGDLGWRNDRAELHISITAANTNLNQPGTTPVELLAVAPRALFTAPNYLGNRYVQLATSGSYDINDTTSVQALAYYNYFRQRIRNGNVTPIASCNDGSGNLCVADGVFATGRDGNPIPDFLAGGPYTQLDQQNTNTNGYGASAQVTNTGDLFGRHNKLVAGLSFDGAQTLFNASSEIGGIGAVGREFIGPGITIAQPDGSIAPVRLGITNAYYGAFVADTFDVAPRLSLTVSGRFNAAQIDLKDQNGTALTGNHSYTRFNPAAGLAYQVTPWLTAYAGYSEANRAPTPAELSCASAAAPCSLANFFVGDPDLKQVIARTIEAGFRGSVAPYEAATLRYNIGLFRTGLSDDIAFVNSPVEGRAFFQNVGRTRRQGIDAGISFTTPRLFAYLNYSYTDATFRQSFIESSQNNPASDANGNTVVMSGNRLPGVPTHIAKFGAQYKVTDQWAIGGAGLAVSGAYLFGDEANLTPKLPGYVRLDLNTSYQITPHIQLFGVVENVTNAKYYTYGTFSPTGSVAIAQSPGASNPRAYSIAAPIGGFGGVKVTF